MKSFRISVVLLVVLVIVSAFIGGIISNQLFKKQAVQESEKKKVIEAQEFRLVDKDGKLLGLFGEYDGFQGTFQGLFIFDKRGDPRTVVIGSQICIFDGNMKKRIDLSDSGILISDEHEKTRISLTSDGNMENSE